MTQLSSVKTALWRASARIARVPGCRVCVYCTVCVVYCTLYSVLSYYTMSVVLYCTERRARGRTFLRSCGDDSALRWRALAAVARPGCSTTGAVAIVHFGSVERL